MERLELIHAFRSKYSYWVSSYLYSLKFCSDGKHCWLEYLKLENLKSNASWTSLENHVPLREDLPFFCGKDDIVDNASAFLALEEPFLLHHFSFLFSKEARIEHEELLLQASENISN